MKWKRIMIAAPKSGSGKTTVTLALLQALKESGKRVVSYKCGPDYIDPMFHEKIIGIPSKNLDTFFTGAETTRQLFQKGRSGEEFVVLEGVMGLFDGLGGIREEGSSYHLAEITRTPVILVVDAKGAGRSILPLILGFLAYDRERLIRGVILNRITGTYYEILKPLLEAEFAEFQVKLLGYLPADENFRIAGRYLGLVLPDEQKQPGQQVRELAGRFLQTVRVEEIVRMAESAGALPGTEETAGEAPDAGETAGEVPGEERNTCRAPAGPILRAGAGRILTAHPVIAVARDEAFCFYYADNIRLLEENGAKLVYFSPIHDRKLPECQALLLGGGYPELYAGELSANSGMRAAIRRAAERGTPLVAECGGFLYLHTALTDKEGVRHEMAGVLGASCHDTGKLVRFGYVELKERHSRFLPEGERIRGHEFHYYDSTENGSGCIAVKPVTGRSYSCVVENPHSWMGFPHLYYPSNPAFVRRFVEMARESGTV